MDWHKEIARSFPRRHDDEPASLRQDIADELADHLLCAADREMTRGADAATARRTARERFGDVRRVARRLWFDAMKERLMLQRLTLAGVLVLAIAGAAVTALLWEAVRENREVNAAILERLASLQPPAESREPPEPRAAPAPPLDWIPVEVRLEPPPDSPPPEGATVTLSGNLLGDGQKMEITEQTGPDGTATISMVRPGQHFLKVELPWGEEAGRSVTVLPGAPFVATFPIPAPLPKAEVAFRVDWPADLQGEHLVALAYVEPELRTAYGRQWRLPSWSSRGAIPSGKTVLIRPDGKVAVVDGLLLGAYRSRSDFNAAAQYPDYPDPGDFRETVEWPALRYRVSPCSVIRGTPEDFDARYAPSGLTWEAVLHIERSQLVEDHFLPKRVEEITSIAAARDWLSRSQHWAEVLQNLGLYYYTPVAWATSEEHRTFTLQPGEVTTVTIEVPQEAAAEIRLRLALPAIAEGRPLRFLDDETQR